MEMTEVFTCLFCHYRGINKQTVDKWRVEKNQNFQDYILTTVLGHWRMLPLLLLPLQSRFHEETIHRNLLNISLGRDPTHQHFNTQFLYAELNRKNLCKITTISALWACSGLGRNWRPVDCAFDFKTQKPHRKLLHWDWRVEPSMMHSAAGTGWWLLRISGKHACYKLEFKNPFTE